MRRGSPADTAPMYARTPAFRRAARTPEAAPRSEENFMSYSTPDPHPSVPDPSTYVATSEAVEIRVFWEDALLEVIELSPPRAFFIGDGSVSPEQVDFTVPDLEDERVALLVQE